MIVMATMFCFDRREQNCINLKAKHAAVMHTFPIRVIPTLSYDGKKSGQEQLK